MSYNFTYIGNPISNNNPQSMGYRSSTNTAGTMDSSSNVWFFQTIPSLPYPDPQDPTRNLTIQKGTYLIQSTLISVNNTNLPVTNALYIIGNKSATDNYYGSMIDVSNGSLDISKFNQGIAYSIDDFCPSFVDSNWVVLSGKHEYNLQTNKGTTLSTSTIFTYTKTPTLGTSDIAAICWYAPTNRFLAPFDAVAYNTLTRIA